MDEVQQDHWPTDSPRALLCIFGLCDTVHVTAGRSKSQAIWYTGCLKSGKYWFSTGKLSDIRCAQVVLHISSKKPKRESQSNHRHSTTFKAQVTQIDSNPQERSQTYSTHCHPCPHNSTHIPIYSMHCPTQSAALDSSRRHGANRRSGSFQPSFRSRSVCPAIALYACETTRRVVYRTRVFNVCSVRHWFYTTNHNVFAFPWKCDFLKKYARTFDWTCKKPQRHSLFLCAKCSWQSVQWAWTGFCWRLVYRTCVFVFFLADGVGWVGVGWANNVQWHQHSYLMLR